MIITIDGPAGAGKSTVARALARRLNFRFLDTGAMYRAVALAALRRGYDWDLPDDLARLARKLTIAVDGDRIIVDGEDVSEAVRSTEVTAVTRYAADNPLVRAASGRIAAPAGRRGRHRRRGARSGDGGLPGSRVQDLPHRRGRGARPAPARRPASARRAGDVRGSAGGPAAARLGRRLAAGRSAAARPGRRRGLHGRHDFRAGGG